NVVEQHFRPEFLNRIDEIILFHPLSASDLRAIVQLQTRALRSMIAERHVDLEISEPALDLLAREGYDPVYGARPLKRLIQRKVVNPLAVKLLAGEIREGAAVRVDVRDGDLQFETVGET